MSISARTRAWSAGPSAPSAWTEAYTPSMTTASRSASAAGSVAVVSAESSSVSSRSRSRTQALVAMAITRAGCAGSGNSARVMRKGATATALRLDLLAERVEQREDPLTGGAEPGPGHLRHPFLVAGRVGLNVGGDQVVLGGEQPVEGRRGHFGLGGDPVHAGRPDPLPVEEPLGDRQDMLAGLGCRSSPGGACHGFRRLGVWELTR